MGHRPGFRGDVRSAGDRHLAPVHRERRQHGCNDERPRPDHDERPGPDDERGQRHDREHNRRGSAVRRPRRRHAASRARKLTAALSVLTFVAIGRAIDLTAGAATSAQPGVAVQGVVTSPSLPSTNKRSASAAAASLTTTAVTSTHAS